MRLLAGLFAIGLAFAADDPNRLTDVERREGYFLLFSGKTLEDWEGNPAVWWVEDGVIVGSSERQKVEQNTFLIYKKRPFADFVLKTQVRLKNGNSGIQFRSTVLPGPGWVVAGYQADLSHAGDRSAWGNFYEERGRGRGLMKTQDEGWQRAKRILRPHDWNEYEILAQGSRVRLTLNGVVTIDSADDKASTGVIALQLHSGEPMRVEYRGLKVKVLR